MGLCLVLAIRFTVGNWKILLVSGMVRVLVGSVVGGDVQVVMPVKVDLRVGVVGLSMVRSEVVLFRRDSVLVCAVIVVYGNIMSIVIGTVPVVGRVASVVAVGSFVVSRGVVMREILTELLFVDGGVVDSVLALVVAFDALVIVVSSLVMAAMVTITIGTLMVAVVVAVVLSGGDSGQGSDDERSHNAQCKGL